MFMAPDPWWGGKIYWLGCTCDGKAEEATAPIGKFHTSFLMRYHEARCLTSGLEAATAHEYVHNENGVLTC
jgi:hypothetical protein